MSPQQSPDGPQTDAATDDHLSRRTLIAISGAVGTTVLAGCSASSDTTGTDATSDSSDGSGSETSDGQTSGGSANTATGTFRLLISDQPVAIDDFDSLEVSFDRARIFRQADETEDESEAQANSTAEESGSDMNSTAEESGSEANSTSGEVAAERDAGADSGQQGFSVIDLDGATVDLTQVLGEKATAIFEGELPEDRYTKIELYASDVGGVVDGESADVTIPSGKLQIVKPFEVRSGETLPFVFDINVVKKGKTGSYNLLPVISESGVAGTDVEVTEVENETATGDQERGENPTNETATGDQESGENPTNETATGQQESGENPTNETGRGGGDAGNGSAADGAAGS